MLPEQPIVQPQPEAWVLESPPPAYSRTDSGPGGRATSSQTALTTSEAGLKKPLPLAVVSDCRVHYRIPSKITEGAGYSVHENSLLSEVRSL